MKLKIKYFAIVLLIFIGCKQKTEPKLSESSVKSERRSIDTTKIIDASKDAEYVVNTYSSGLFSIEAAEIVKKKVMNKQVRLIAEMVLERHRKIVDEIDQLALNKKISLPSKLNMEQRSKINALQEEAPAKVEEEFLRQMETEHKQDIVLFEKLSRESEDNEISSLAVFCLSELQSQYDQLVDVKENLNL